MATLILRFGSKKTRGSELRGFVKVCLEVGIVTEWILSPPALLCLAGQKYLHLTLVAGPVEKALGTATGPCPLHVEGADPDPGNRRPTPLAPALRIRVQD